MEKELLDYINKVLEVCSSRAEMVIKHILEHGSINSEQIAEMGYVHGARAVGDVRDQGVPLITGKTKSSNNRNIAEYRFGPASEIRKHKFGGRVNFPASLKNDLIERDGLFCAISNQPFEADKLQIDHKVPYYISGDIDGTRNPKDFMLLSSSMQRAKSWECESCQNLIKHFDISICKTCYWASPESYSHVAMREQRSLHVTWDGKDEVKGFDMLAEESKQASTTPQVLIKKIINERYDKD